MNLKNAVAVCLLSFFSATLVVLIARALDLQAASRLEPQLVRIVEELEAIRKQGGIGATPGSAGGTGAVEDGLMVYYFHSNDRCVTCRALEAYSYATVEADFGPELKSGAVVWKVLNYDKPAGEELKKKFDIQNPVIVLARMQDGQIADWKRLDKVWGLAVLGDENGLMEEVREGIREMLKTADQAPAAGPESDVSEVPVPGESPSESPAAPDPADIPVPE